MADHDSPKSPLAAASKADADATLPASRPASALAQAAAPASDGTVPVVHLGTEAPPLPPPAEPAPLATDAPRPPFARSLLAASGLLLLLALVPTGYVLLREEEYSCQCGEKRHPMGRKYWWQDAPDCVPFCLQTRAAYLRERATRHDAARGTVTAPGERQPAPAKFAPRPYEAR